MRFPKSTIGQRLTWSYGTVVALLIVVAFFGIYKLGSLSRITDATLREKYPATIVVNQLSNDLNIIAREMRNTLIFNDQAHLQDQLNEINKAKINMAAELEQVQLKMTDPDSKELLNEIKIVHSAYLVNQEDFIHLVAEHKMGEARNLLLVDLNGYQDIYFELLEKLRADQINLMTLASKEVEDTYFSARKLMFILSALAIVLSIGITVIITRSLLKQLGGEPDYAVSIAKKIALGDLSSFIALDSNDHSSLLYSMSAMRESLIERTNALQDTNRELALTIETLNQAQADLIFNEKLAALGSLVAGIAHELNTPIGNGIMAASTLIEFSKAFEAKSVNGVSRASLKMYLAQMQEGADILQRNLDRAGSLIASFKQVAVDRTTSGARRFALAEVISEIILTLQPAIKKRPHLIKQDIPPEIMMDSYPGPLGQVLTNLINNALIHGFDQRESGNDPGIISISARTLSDSHIEIKVHDNGCGISPDNLSRIYDPFFTTKFGKGGSGLGLHISHNIVCGVLGGKIHVDSELKVGTTFILTLPVKATNLQH
ncbi:ATP-binding protein [Solimicrobium silvestre]|uniref:histidine kinase n=1 Tax=Solimicrobium silvestre TaxID=2099400 RepID=A0A2S9H3U8_9BURK|nr:ATP-binding protein [Solimicrobium silvestre]PRC94647.1 Histidine kinase-, DNA gyrase B-, and HSP90-like ATPase [Solimicrobium silvestre]